MNGGAGAGKTVLKVLYFILTFLLGGLLAVMLPNWLLYENVSSGVAESLEAERYTGSVLPLSGYFRPSGMSAAKTRSRDSSCSRPRSRGKSRTRRPGNGSRRSFCPTPATSTA